MFSENGGLNWDTKDLGILPLKADINSAYIYDKDHIWLTGTYYDQNYDELTQVGLHAFILITSNGGNTWEMKEFQHIRSFGSVTFISETKGYVVVDRGSDLAEAKLYYTEDAGYTWTAVEEVYSTQGMLKVILKGPYFGIVMGDKGDVFRFTNK